jgi:hypothetical protein
MVEKERQVVEQVSCGVVVVVVGKLSTEGRFGGDERKMADKTTEESEREECDRVTGARQRRQSARVRMLVTAYGLDQAALTRVGEKVERVRLRLTTRHRVVRQIDT